MFNKGETVIYGSSGICTVSDIRKENFAGEKKLYYILKPVSERGTTVYHPVDGDESKLRLPLTAEQANELLKSDFTSAVIWQAGDIARREMFDEILKEKEPVKLLSLINIITKKKIEKADNGKKLRAADEKALNDAKKIILGEFSFVTGKSEDEILEIITKK